MKDVTLSRKDTVYKINLMHTYAKSMGWHQEETQPPLMMYTKSGYRCIPGKITLIWDAEDCVVATILYHENRQKWTIKIRKINYSRVLWQIVCFPREHLAKNEEGYVPLVSYIFDDEPTMQQVAPLWEKAIKKLYKIN